MFELKWVDRELDRVTRLYHGTARLGNMYARGRRAARTGTGPAAAKGRR
jgi:hypothetical protein